MQFRGAALASRFKSTIVMRFAASSRRPVRGHHIRALAISLSPHRNQREGERERRFPGGTCGQDRPDPVRPVPGPSEKVATSNTGEREWGGPSAGAGAPVACHQLLVETTPQPGTPIQQREGLPVEKAEVIVAIAQGFVTVIDSGAGATSTASTFGADMLEVG